MSSCPANMKHRFTLLFSGGNTLTRRSAAKITFPYGCVLQKLSGRVILVPCSIQRNLLTLHWKIDRIISPTGTHRVII